MGFSACMHVLRRNAILIFQARKPKEKKFVNSMYSLGMANEKTFLNVRLPHAHWL